ncbi:hypothetical protein [Fischerella major]|uniref:hypothetical protein n=1 Tax=Fischerella major TaxID=210993 RepID=UPI000AB6FEF0|nr:hypothetical protein [Fischerella major]
MLGRLWRKGFARNQKAIEFQSLRGITQYFYLYGLEISAKGTIFYKGEEFDKPSPLAAKVGGAANGWEYIEVKKNDQWIRLEELRQIWRSTNDKK